MSVSYKREVVSLLVFATKMALGVAVIFGLGRLGLWMLDRGWEVAAGVTLGLQITAAAIMIVVCVLLLLDAFKKQP